jgi:hypothetical protein
MLLIKIEVNPFGELVMEVLNYEGKLFLAELKEPMKK